MPEDTFLDALSLRRPSLDESSETTSTSASFSGYALDQAGVAAWLLAIDELEGLDDIWLIQSTASAFGDNELPVVAFVTEGNVTTEMMTPRAVGTDPDADADAVDDTADTEPGS